MENSLNSTSWSGHDSVHIDHSRKLILEEIGVSSINVHRGALSLCCQNQPSPLCSLSPGLYCKSGLRAQTWQTPYPGPTLPVHLHRDPPFIYGNGLTVIDQDESRPLRRPSLDVQRLQYCSLLYMIYDIHSESSINVDWWQYPWCSFTYLSVNYRQNLYDTLKSYLSGPSQVALFSKGNNPVRNYTLSWQKALHRKWYTLIRKRYDGPPNHTHTTYVYFSINLRTVYT